VATLHFAAPRSMLNEPRGHSPMPDKSAKPDTTSDRKIDPFKPAQPRIPGVFDAPAPKNPVQEEPTFPGAEEKPRFSLPFEWNKSIAGGLFALAVLGALAMWWGRSRANTAAQPSMPPVESTLGTPPQAAPATSGLPTAPGTVATTEELAKPWAFKKFNYHDSLRGEQFAAMVVHLPEGGYWAFSLEEPYGKCELELMIDTTRLRAEYGVAAGHPMVVDPCTHAVYDLLRYGSGPAGLVRGEVIAGPAIRPPLAVEVRVEGHRIVAARVE
jgi:hypothetical protein